MSFLPQSHSTVRPDVARRSQSKRWVSYPRLALLQHRSTSIGSPCIHETGRKIGAVFQEAASHAPSVVTLTKWMLFWPSAPQVETIEPKKSRSFCGVFRRRRRTGVLVIGMTNSADSIDRAILRRGRFDHVMSVEPRRRRKSTLSSNTNSKSGRESTDSWLNPTRPLCRAALSDAAFLYVKPLGWLLEVQRTPWTWRHSMVLSRQCCLGIVPPLIGASVSDESHGARSLRDNHFSF